MREYIVEKVSVPKNSIANESLSSIHYSDAYKILLPGESAYDVKIIASKFLTTAPPWVSHLMKVRDRLVSFIGLKTTNRSKVENINLEQGSSIGLFRVFKCNSHEILLGEDDRHLDFRVSILVEEVNGLNYLTVSTVVNFHNWMGKVYFFIVKKVHKVIVPAMLNNIVRM
ncbi:MAG: DUF2867 domain-containing protein [Mesobacillus sp.]|uniref:DUF2867 domain-containing protein n=1 Tax=Mesobacillus sp. TaxID=2675271 RepID=UPI003C401AEB